MLSEREYQSIQAHTLDRLLEWHLRYRGSPSSVADLLDMVAGASADAVAAERALQQWVEAARRYGATWQEIGDVLGSTRQAAQKRFGEATPPAPPSLGAAAGYETVTNVDISDEEAVLVSHGARGQVLTDVGARVMTFVDTGGPVEHRRVPLLSHGPSDEEYRHDGWEVVSRSYPFVYLARSMTSP